MAKKFVAIEPGQKWKPFLKLHAQGGSLQSDAKLCIRLGGDSPCRTKDRLASLFKRGKIAHSEKRIYEAAIDMMEQARVRTAGSFVKPTPTDWIVCGKGGGHMKKTYIEGIEEGYDNRQI